MQDSPTSDLIAFRPRIVPSILLIVGFLVTPDVAAEQSLTQLRAESRQLLKDEATASTGASQDAAIAALCDMYVVMQLDPRLGSSEMLQGDAAKLRRRLLNIARRREAVLKRSAVPRPAELDAEIKSSIQAAIGQSQRGEPIDVQSGRGGGAVPDEGWRLVELIQRVVAPDFWENRGGPGAIRYFAMRRVLVVRATTDVHQQIKDLLRALR